MCALMVDAEFLTELPLIAPRDGRVLVHNRGRPGRRLGQRGFRAWLQLPAETLEPCPCGWAPGMGQHFRMRLPI
jgi:hypothetical protein